MKPGFVVHLGVKRGAKQIALLNRHDSTIGKCGEHLDSRSNGNNFGSADKRRRNRRLEAQDRKRCLKRVNLTAKGVAAHDNIEATKTFLALDAVEHLISKQNQTCARAINRQPSTDCHAKRLCQSEGSCELVDNARFATRNNERLDLGQLLSTAHKRNGCAEPLEHSHVFPHVALERQDPNAHGGFDCYQPRSANRCGAGTSCTLMPTMASPSPRETSAIAAGSS